MKDAYKFFGQRIGGRETQAHGTAAACANVMCLGIREKFDVNGAQGHGETESDEQDWSESRANALVSLSVDCVIRARRFRDCRLIPFWTGGSQCSILICSQLPWAEWACFSFLNYTFNIHATL